MVVLPAPVGPTMAILCPGAAERLRPCRTSLPGTYENETSSMSTLPSTSFGASALPVSSSISGVSRNSNTLSQETATIWTLANAPAILVSGMLSSLAYTMNATTVP